MISSQVDRVFAAIKTIDTYPIPVRFKVNLEKLEFTALLLDVLW